MQVWNDCLFVLTKKTHQLLYAPRLNGLRDKVILRAHPAFEDCKIQKLAFGAYHMFVLTEEGVVFTLGDNEVGQQGIPISTVKIIKTPMQTEILSQISVVSFFVETGIKVLDVACGDNFSLFLTNEGIFGAGSSLQGQMGGQWAS